MLATCPEPETDYAGYNGWYSPEHGVRVFMHPDVTERLNADALRTLHDPAEGFETGGILLGAVLADQSPPVVAIEDYERVSLASPGPYQPTAADRERFRQKLARAGSRNGCAPVGYFRTDRREDAALDAFDTQLIEECFPEPESVHLTLRPYEIGICLAAFFFREGGRIVAVSDDETAFVQQRRGPVRAAETSGPAEEPLPVRVPFEAAAAPKTPRKPRRWPLAAAAGVVLAAGLALIPYLSRGRQGMLGLRAEPIPSGGVLVSWNLNAPPFRRAARAALNIVDGSRRRSIDMDAGDLRSGQMSNMTVFPDSRSVTFQLELSLADGQSVSETVPYRAEAAPAPQAAAQFSPPPAPRPAPETADRIATTRAPVAAPAIPRPDRARAPRREAPAAASEPARPSPAAETPAPETRTPAPAPQVQPPPAKQPAEVAQAAAPASVPAPNPPLTFPTRQANTPAVLPPVQLPQAQQPQVQQTPAPPPPQPAEPAPQLRIASGRPSQPVLIQSVQPSIPRDYRRLITREVSMEVNVTIDARGKVTKAELVRSNSPISGILAPTILSAARLYRFTPARLDNVAVPSQSVLTFRIAP